MNIGPVAKPPQRGPSAEGQAQHVMCAPRARAEHDVRRSFVCVEANAMISFSSSATVVFVLWLLVGASIARPRLSGLGPSLALARSLAISLSTHSSSVPTGRQATRQRGCPKLSRIALLAARRGAGESGMKNPSTRACSAGPESRPPRPNRSKIVIKGEAGSASFLCIPLHRRWPEH
jgi:hypothetical protein